MAVTGIAVAAIPGDITDVAYQSAAWGSDRMRSEGYTLVSSSFHDGSSYEYWWKGSSQACVQARIRDGKYESLKTTSSTDCRQYHQAATGDDNAAAIAIGAAALLGVAAIAHQSHERNERHGHDSKSVAEFDRGYRDGLYHEPYHNYGNSPAYSDGYNAGHQQRAEQTSYRPRYGGYSGYQAYVSLEDLVGVRGSSADSELRSRGFRDTGGYKRKDKSFVTWYNPGTRQCVQAVTKDGSIRRFDTIDVENCL